MSDPRTAQAQTRARHTRTAQSARARTQTSTRTHAKCSCLPKAFVDVKRISRRSGPPCRPRRKSGNPGIRESGNLGIRESGNPLVRSAQSSDPCGEPFFNFVLFCTFPADRATCFVVTDCWLREGLRLKVSPGRAGLWAGRLPKSAEQGGRAPPHRPGRRYRPLRSLAASGGLGSAPYAMVLYG